MSKIKLNEIIECSSQKSILTGQAGFGIRTLTEGLDADLARKITEQVNCAYEVDICDQVTAEQIEQDPQIVCNYPRTIKYTIVKDDDDNEKYIVACSTYIGIDYGYFCGMDSARRAGTNYIADILVFDERPTAALIAALVKQKAFLPFDNTCSPDNQELQELLTGEPSYLKPREIEINAETPVLDETTAWIAITLLQAKINQDLGTAKSLQSIVFQAQDAKVPAILGALPLLPEALVSDKYFHTNYLQGYGMPKGYRMMFLNEHNKEQVYIDNYVYLNLDNGETINIDKSNAYFLKIKEAAKSGDLNSFQTVINYLCQNNYQEILQKEEEERKKKEEEEKKKKEKEKEAEAEEENEDKKEEGTSLVTAGGKKAKGKEILAKYGKSLCSWAKKVFKKK